MSGFAGPLGSIVIKSGTGAALISAYLVRETGRPLLFSMLITLAALLLERTLRLLEILSSHGGPLELVFQLTINLLPHYLGLALPATFFISLFVVIAKFDTYNELISISGVGISLYRIARPLVLIGVLFAFISIGLFGFIQPYSRYLYREIMHAVTSTMWNATLHDRVFARLGDELTIYADEVDVTGRRLAGIFIREAHDGTEVVTTAAQGALRINDAHTRLQLVLRDGARTTFKDGAEAMTVNFSDVTLGRDFAFDAAPFRPRGKDGRELTLIEIWHMIGQLPPGLARAELSAEFHTRAVRALSLPLLPFLAMAMGIAAKRASRSIGIAAGGLILVLYHHIIQLGGSLTASGSLSAGSAIWLPFALFSAFSLWAFHRTNASPGGNPFNIIFGRIESLVAALTIALRPVRPPEPAAPGKPEAI